MTQKNRTTAAALTGTFILAALAIAPAAHIAQTLKHDATLRDAALRDGYATLDQRANEQWGYQTALTHRGLLSMSAHFHLQLVEKDGDGARLCKYSGTTYHAFGTPLLSRGTTTCAPAARGPQAG